MRRTSALRASCDSEQALAKQHSISERVLSSTVRQASKRSARRSSIREPQLGQQRHSLPCRFCLPQSHSAIQFSVAPRQRRSHQTHTPAGAEPFYTRQRYGKQNTEAGGSGEMARIKARIRVLAMRPSLSDYEIIHICGVRETDWHGRKYLWPQKCDAVVENAGGSEHIVVAEEGAIIAVYGLAADSRRHKQYFVALLRLKSGAKASGNRIEAENAELIAEVLDEQFAKVTADMAVEGYSASLNMMKRTANIAAWLYKKLVQEQKQQREEKKEAKEEKQEQKKAEGRKASESSVVARIERLLSELAEQKPPATAGEQMREEKQPTQQPKQQEQQATAAVDLKRGVIMLPDGTVLVRFWLLKFQKTSEYAVQDVSRKLNGSKEVEEVRKIPADVARRLSSLRREVNAMLADVAEVITLESVFGKSSGMWLVLYESGLEKVKRIYDYAVAEVKRIAQLLKLPKEQAKKLVDGYKMHVSQWWLPVDEAIALLEQLRTAVSSAAQAKQEKLKELKGYRARQELARYQQLIAKLQKLEQKLKELQHLAARA